MLFQLSYVHLLLMLSCALPAVRCAGLLPEMHKGRPMRLRVPGLDDLVDSASTGAARCVPVRFGTYTGGSSWLVSH